MAEIDDVLKQTKECVYLDQINYRDRRRKDDLGLFAAATWIKKSECLSRVRSKETVRIL